MVGWYLLSLPQPHTTATTILLYSAISCYYFLPAAKRWGSVPSPVSCPFYSASCLQAFFRAGLCSCQRYMCLPSHSISLNLPAAHTSLSLTHMHGVHFHFPPSLPSPSVPIPIVLTPMIWTSSLICFACSSHASLQLLPALSSLLKISHVACKTSALFCCCLLAGTIHTSLP